MPSDPYADIVGGTPSTQAEPDYTTVELGAYTKDGHPGKRFFPAMDSSSPGDFVWDHAAKKIWLPKAQAWGQLNPDGSFNLGKQNRAITTDADEIAQARAIATAQGRVDSYPPPADWSDPYSAIVGGANPATGQGERAPSKNDPYADIVGPTRLPEPHNPLIHNLQNPLNGTTAINPNAQPKYSLGSARDLAMVPENFYQTLNHATVGTALKAASVAGDLNNRIYNSAPKWIQNLTPEGWKTNKDAIGNVRELDKANDAALSERINRLKEVGVTPDSAVGQVSGFLGNAAGVLTELAVAPGSGGKSLLTAHATLNSLDKNLQNPEVSTAMALGRGGAEALLTYGIMSIPGADKFRNAMAADGAGAAWDAFSSESPTIYKNVATKIISKLGRGVTIGSALTEANQLLDKAFIDHKLPWTPEWEEIKKSSAEMIAWEAIGGLQHGLKDVASHTPGKATPPRPIGEDLKGAEPATLPLQGTSPSPEPARTRESVLEEAKHAFASGDLERVMQLQEEAKSLAPVQEPAREPVGASDSQPLLTEPITPEPLTKEKISSMVDDAIKDGVRNPSEWLSGLKGENGEAFDGIYKAVGGVEGANKLWREHSFGIDSSEPVTGTVKVDSPQFKEFFGDSKAVDESGKPQRFYHGTLNEIEGFSPSRKGIFFSPDPEFASKFAQGNDGRVMPVYLRAEKPFDFKSPEALADFKEWSEQGDRKAEFHNGEPNPDVEAGNWSVMESAPFQKFLKERGYDSYYVDENGVKNLAVLDPSQIKSALSNTGKYSKTNGMIGDMFGLGSGYEATMNTLKRSLDLPLEAKPTEVASAVMERIGHLGASVKETAVRIMSKIKGITREVATAIAEHLHQAVSGSRESQLGAVGPDIKDLKAEHRKRFSDFLNEVYPSDSPEDVAARHAAWSKYRYTEPAQAKEQEPVPAEPEPKATQEPYDRAKGFVKGITQPIRDLGGVAKAMSSGSNEATNRVVDELNRREVLPKPYEKGSLEVPKLVRPVIFGEQKPSVIKDLPRDVHGKGFVNTFQHYMESPHNIEEPVFGAGKTPTQDAQMAIVSMVHNMNNMGKMFRDLFRTTNIEDHSTEMQAVAKPLFDKFVRASAKLDPLQAQRDVLEKAVEKATKKGTGIDEAKSALKDWDSRNGDALKQAKSEMGDINDAHQAMLRDFASKYGDARVALAAEYAPDKVPDWIKLSPDEQVATAKFREAMEAYRAQMERLGIPWREGGYVTHLTKFLAEDTGSPQERRSPREVLSFAHREEGSSQWLPSAHAAAADYVPNASRKIAMQEFYNKWRPMIDPKNMEGLSNPASPNYAPNASKYLTEMFKALDSPDAHNFIDKVFNRLRGYENAKLLAGSMRVTWKHFGGKLPSLLAQNDVWTAPGALGQVKALVGKISADSPIRKAIDNLGGNTVDWAKKAQLVSYFANTREILGMLRENPFTSAVEEARRYGMGNVKTNKMFIKMFGNKAPDVIANMRHGIQMVSSNPVATMEAWENGLDLLSSIEKAQGHGMSPQESIPAFLNNILDFNFRGGADSPLIIKDQRTRNWVQFVQTPIKLAELKAKLIRNAWNGGKDLYGTDHTANLVKHVVMTGIALAAAKKAGVNLVDSILHLPFVNADQGSRLVRMAYFGAKMNILNDPAARRKFNEAKLAFIGSPQRTVMGSPVFDLAKDVNTATTTGVPGLVKQTPIFSQIKAIATGKPPEGFDSVGAYLTGERTERSKKAQEGKAVRAGAREERYQRKSEARR